jgi:hypothetical protein
LVRTLACHARGRRFEPVPGRHFYAAVAQSVERILGKDEVGGSNPPSSSNEKHSNLTVWVLFALVFITIFSFLKNQQNIVLLLVATKVATWLKK